MEATRAFLPSLVAAAGVWVVTGGSPHARDASRPRALSDVLQQAASRLASSRVGAFVVDSGLLARQVTDMVALAGRRGIVCTREAAAAAVVGVCALAAVAGMVVSSSAVGAPIGAGLAVLALVLRSASLDRAERVAVSRDMPEVFRSLAVAMSSGKTLAQAIAYVGAHGRGKIGEAFSRTALRLRCGMSVDDAMEQLQEGLDAPGIPLLVCALGISQRTGSPLEGLFQRAALLVERQGELERVLAVKTAQVRMSVRVVCLLPVVLTALLSLVSPDFRAGLATPVGGGCVAVAAVLDGLAVLIIRRLLAGVL